MQKATSNNFFRKHAAVLFTIPCLIAVIYSLGFRAKFIGSDTEGYILAFNIFSSTGTVNTRYDWLFLSTMKGVALCGANSSYWFAIIVFVNIVLCGINAYLANNLLGNVRNNSKYLLFVYILTFISPFFISAQINVIRQGLSLSFVFLFYLLALNRYSTIWLLFSAIIATGFHSSAWLFILPSIGLLYRYKTIIKITLLLVLLYVTHVFSYLIEKFSLLFNYSLYDKIMNYGVNGYYITGVKYKFLIFTLGMGAIAHSLGKYLQLASHKEKYFDLMKIYWLLALPFYFIGFGKYSDRLLFPSWNFLPFIFAATLKKGDDFFCLPLYLWMLVIYCIGILYLIYNLLT